MQDDRFPERSDPAGEPASDRNPDALAHFVLKPARGPCDQVVVLTALPQKHGCGVGIEDGSKPFEHLDE